MMFLLLLMFCADMGHRIEGDFDGQPIARTARHGRERCGARDIRAHAGHSHAAQLARAHW